VFQKKIDKETATKTQVYVQVSIKQIYNIEENGDEQ
jgi:hypothetical protein